MAPGTIEPDFRQEPLRNKEVAVETKNDEAPLTMEEIFAYERDYSVAGMPPHPVIITKAQGAHLWDSEGKQYVDLLAGFCSANQGHCHPKIIATLREQCLKMTLPGRAVYTEAYSRMCRRMCHVFGFERCASMNSGSEAVDFSVKLARKWAYQIKGIPRGEALILTAAGNYHGRSFIPLSASTNPKLKEDSGPFVPGIGPTVDGKTVRYGNTDDLEEVFKANGHRIAAFMFEGIQGNAGCLPPPDGYFKSVRELCDKYNILMVSDEIQAGLGRTGYLVTYDRERIQPDILLLGKSVTGGTIPMGLILTRHEVMNLMKPGQHGSTFAGNPLACAVATTAVNVILEENLPERSLRLGNELMRRLKAINSPFIADAIGQGLFISLWLNEDPTGRVTGRRLAALLLSRGVLTYAYVNKIRIAPPLVISEEALYDAVDKIEAALNDLSTMEGAIKGE